MNMAHSLQGIDWSGLTDASGSASDLPDVLIRLTAPEAHIRKQALDKVWERLGHQESRYEATPHAVSFLVSVLDSVPPATGVEILKLLAFIAVGDDLEYLLRKFDPEALRREVEHGRRLSDADLVEEYNSRKKDVEDLYPRLAHERTFEAVLARAKIQQDENELALRCYDAVRSHLVSLEDLLSHSDPGIRKWTLAVLGFYPQEAPKTVPLILRVLQREQSPEVTSTALLALGLIRTEHDPESSAFLGRFIDAAHPWIRWSAAISLALMGTPPSQAVPVILECIERRKGEPTGIPYYMGHIGSLASLLIPSSTDDDLWEADF